MKEFNRTIEMEGFRFVRTLGRGGFASTLLFADLTRQYGEYVAVKAPHDREKEEPLIRGDMLSLFSLRESPFIVKFLDTRRVGDRYVLLMEYVDGPLLRSLVGAPGTSRRLPLDQALRYTLHVAQGLEAAHARQMVHRDIKPDNIIIDGKTDTAKILDFGMASLLDAGGVFKTKFGGHTPYYTPLEVLLEKAGDHRVDVYSLGVTLYEMLSGTLPFYKPEMTPYHLVWLMKEEKPKNLRELEPGVPRFVEWAVMKAISRQPGDRFDSVAEFVQALDVPVEIKSAQEHINSGSVRRAEHILRSLLGRRPWDTRGHVALANLLNRCYRPLEAMEVLNQALELDPSDPVVNLRLGVTLLKLERKDEAGKRLRLADRCCSDKKIKRSIASLLASIDPGAAGK